MLELNVLVLISLFCWGFWGISDKKALAHGSQFEVMLCLYFLSLLLIPPVVLSLNIVHPGWSLPADLLFWTGLASLAYTGAIFSYLSAMSKTEASFVLGITASYPLVLQILAAVFLGEALVWQRLLGGLVIGAGIGMIGGSQTKREEKLPPEQKIQLVLSVVMATLCWGVWGLFDKKALASGGPLEVYLAQRLWDLFFLLLFLCVLFWRKIKFNWRNKKLWLFSAGSEGAVAAGGLAYLGALSQASASYVITITGCYPLVMYILALFLLKEKFNAIRFAGIVLVVCGGLLVQLTQSQI
ncbi:MAG: DMT family transporter [Candidatus Obscuribacterales bacterium]|nr:DMT family transporter [Candidatus Obscuribacterales bacterium]